MSKYLFILLLLLGITANANAQEMMLNGSFEDFDGNPDGDTVLSTVNYAAYWRNLIGSCDLVHPDVPVEMSGNPCFGIGAGRFGVSTSGYVEYMYGQTQPLTAGQLYEVSFWIRKDASTDVLRKIGLVMTDYVPTTSITSATPLISHLATSTQCVKLNACFTAQSTATHYVTIGPFEGEGTTESLVYLVDSVSVRTIPPNVPLAQASLSVSEPILCHGELATLNGTASANETSYEWNIYSNISTLVYSSGIIQGTAGSITPVLPFMTPGNCFRAELTVYGVCKDVATVEFCVADPNIDFIFDGNPVCENTPVDLQVTGDNGWVYTWTQAGDTLANGTGIQALTVTPTMGNGVFTVTVTTPEGCTYTESIHLNVNAQNNLAPWMDGINGTGEYTYYVSQGDAVFFNSVLSNDYSNEQINYSHDDNIPTNFAFIDPPSSGGIFSFSWVTTFVTPVGEYYFELSADDQNACEADTGVFRFRIVVVCDQCPICVSHENRTPSGSGTPLPDETKAGKCIEAGLSQTVSTGDANILFQAGSYILEGPYFDAGPGYEGIIDPTTCVTDCEDCCADWDGFTSDPLPNPFYINFNDSDPTNDFIQITDTYHPFCAFGATGFKFEIVNRWGIQMNDQDIYDITLDYCCPFESPAPENPIPHSPIWWDGHTIEPFTGNSVQANDGTYYYFLTLTACNGQTYSTSGYIQIGGQNPNELIISSDGEVSPVWLSSKQQSMLEENQTVREQLDRTLNLFPNPTTGLVQITGSGSEDCYYQVFDEKGVLLSHKEKAVNNNFSLTNYSKGTYYIRIYSGTTYVVRKIVKM